MRAGLIHPKSCEECGSGYMVEKGRVASSRFCSLKCKAGFRHRIAIDGATGCWNWTGTNRGEGQYGCMRRRHPDTGEVSAHRHVYALHKGEIPEGLFLDHLCKNRRCVNPDHLEPVTNQENVIRGDKVQAARAATHCANGHEWTARNTYLHPTQKSRVCRQCTRDAVTRYSAKTEF
jgi:hypothetical protein